MKYCENCKHCNDNFGIFFKLMFIKDAAGNYVFQLKSRYTCNLHFFSKKMIDDEADYIKLIIKDCNKHFQGNFKITVSESDIENLFKTPCSLINFKNDCPEYEEIPVS